MHRQFSLQPFSRHYSHSTNPFLDLLDIDPAHPDRIGVAPEKREHLFDVLTAYKSVHAAGTLLTLSFVTVNDYLWLLRAVSQELSVIRRRAMYYLAAAVSDFFLPRQKMVKERSTQTYVCIANAPLSASLNTRYSPGRAACLSKWTRSRRYSRPWWMNGRTTGILCPSRYKYLVTSFAFDLKLPTLARDRPGAPHTESARRAGALWPPSRDWE